MGPEHSMAVGPEAGQARAHQPGGGVLAAVTGRVEQIVLIGHRFGWPEIRAIRRKAGRPSRFEIARTKEHRIGRSAPFNRGELAIGWQRLFGGLECFSVHLPRSDGRSSVA
jgi:hypothetical protein